MTFNGYHHIGLKVSDAEKSLRFYTDGLGGKLVHQFETGSSGKTIYLVDLGGNAVVEILPSGIGEDEVNARWAHIAVATDDARAAYDLAIKAGALKMIEPNDTNLGGNMPVCIAFVHGPDGETIEMFQVK